MIIDYGVASCLGAQPAFPGRPGRTSSLRLEEAEHKVLGILLAFVVRPFSSYLYCAQTLKIMGTR